VLANANPPVHQVGQRVIEYGLQTLLFHLNDMHRLTPMFEEDIEFQRGLHVKQFLNFLSLHNLISFSYFLTFETIAS
jgi:hypothetical protein